MFQAKQVLTFFMLIFMTVLRMRASNLPMCCKGAVCSMHRNCLQLAEFVEAYASDMIHHKIKVYNLSGVPDLDCAWFDDAEKQEIEPTAERSREPHEAGRAGHAGTPPEVQPGSGYCTRLFIPGHPTCPPDFPCFTSQA